MIYRKSMLIVGAGLGVGLILALGAAKAVGSFVVVNVWDPKTYAAVGLALAPLGSCYLPARVPCQWSRWSHFAKTEVVQSTRGKVVAGRRKIPSLIRRRRETWRTRQIPDRQEPS
jgi:hypothetical protein